MKASELRQDLVSGDWIVIAPRRRFHIALRKTKRERGPRSKCPFEKLSSGNNPILFWPALPPAEKDGNWRLMIIPNKYPAFIHRNLCPVAAPRGPFQTMGGAGHSDLLITREHDANFPNLKQNERRAVFEALRDRYLMSFNDPCVAYVSIFHNWGKNAGASIYHPHYQIMGIPVIPPDVSHSLAGSARYFKKNKRCVHCDIIAWEKKSRRRVVCESREVIAFAPFVSREPFEIRIFPKKHLPYFENTPDGNLAEVAEVLGKVLKKMKNRLGDPDYNFFIHTAPIKDKNKYAHYHWHIEVLPKISISAGFELGTGIEINVVDPDEAAKVLK